VIALRALAVAARQRRDDARAAELFRQGAGVAAAAGLAPFARELVVCAAVIEGSGERLEAALAELPTVADDAARAGDRIGHVWALVARAHLLVRTARCAEARRALEAAQRAREGFAYPYGAMVTARLHAALEALERGFPASCDAWRAAIDAAVGAGELAELALTLRAAAALARRAGDAVSADALLAAVPPGLHASVNGDLFDDDLAGDLFDDLAGDLFDDLAVETRGGNAALRRARARLAEVAAGNRAAAAPARIGPAPRGQLLRGGDFWTVRFAGREAQLPHLKGLEDLAALLACPREEVHCLELAGGSRVEGDSGPLLDARARSDYKERVRELQAEIDEARAANDPGRAERAESELDTLVQQLSEAFGLGGRARRPGSAAERARSAVAWRIRAALKRLGTAHPELGRHLENAVRTGTWCSYRPEADVAWDVRRSATPHGRSS